MAQRRAVVGGAVGALVRSAAFTRTSGLAEAYAEFETLISTFRAAVLDLDRFLKAALLASTRGPP